MNARLAFSVWVARLAVGLVVGLTGMASAQLGIELQLDRHYYLRYETVVATVTLRNYTGNTLIFGGEGGQRGGGFLRFGVLRDGREEVNPLKRAANPVEDLILGAGETRKVTVVLNDLYNLQREGNYGVTVQIGHFRLPQDYRSRKRMFEVRGGAVVWQRAVGVPTRDATAQIKSRQVSLLLLRERFGSVYCLRIENEEMVFGVIRMGPQFLGSQPEVDIDAVSNIHVLFQLRSRLFAHRVYDCEGRLREDKYYLMEKSVPHLYRDAEVGRIMVRGGVVWNKKNGGALSDRRPVIPGRSGQSLR